MTRYKTLRPLAVAGALMAALTVQAQQVGTYTGTTSQGELFELTVIDDGFGNPVFEGAVVFWIGTCTKSGPGRFSAWGIGANAPIVDRKVVFEARYNQLFEKFDLKFNASGSQVTGKFQGKTSEFEDVANSTKSVELCDSGPLTVSASYQAPSGARTALPPAGQARPIAR